MGKNLKEQVERLKGEASKAAALPPDFAQGMSELEVSVALAYIQHGGDTLEVAAQLNLPVMDVLGLTAQPDFKRSVLMFIGLIGGTYDDMLASMQLDFFAGLHDALHSTKDRTRIEALRMLSSMFEGERKRSLRREERALLEVALDPNRELERARTESMTARELTDRLARVGQTLH
jgi:hypothetical protein